MANTHNCPACNVAMEDFGQSHVVEDRRYWHCLSCRHSYRDEFGKLTDLGREGAVRVAITDLLPVKGVT